VQEYSGYQIAGEDKEKVDAHPPAKNDLADEPLQGITKVASPAIVESKYREDRQPADTVQRGIVLLHPERIRRGSCAAFPSSGEHGFSGHLSKSISYAHQAAIQSVSVPAV
jgi:hypothetical protein